MKWGYLYNIIFSGSFKINNENVFFMFSCITDFVSSDGTECYKGIMTYANRTIPCPKQHKLRILGGLSVENFS